MVNIISKYPILTYSYSTNEVDRICGHTFEVFEYYLFLKENGIKSKILIQDNIDKEKIKGAYQDKYNTDLYPYPDQDIIFKAFPNKIIAPSIIYTSGFDYKQPVFITKNLISFRCNKDRDYNIFIKKYPGLKILQDERIYPKNNNSIHYVKKFFFSALEIAKKKNPSKTQRSVVLIYINSSLRMFTKEQLENLINNYNESGKDFLVVSGNQLSKEQLLFFSSYDIDVHIAPVNNLIDKYDEYLYTGISRRFDCSPRLLTESYFYNKKISFDFNFEEYCNAGLGDTGLYWRWYDINNNFNSLDLKEDDLLLKILKGEK